MFLKKTYQFDKILQRSCLSFSEADKIKFNNEHFTD